MMVMYEDECQHETPTDEETLCHHCGERPGVATVDVTRDGSYLWLCSLCEAEVIMWCQQDKFWHKNILNPEKLREHYDRLLIETQDSEMFKDPEEDGRQQRKPYIHPSLQKQRSHQRR